MCKGPVVGTSWARLGNMEEAKVIGEREKRAGRVTV